MASSVPDIATGLSLTFATSGWSPTFVDLNVDGISREALNTTHQGTSGDRFTFEPADFADSGGFNISLFYDQDDDPPVDEDAEDITITWPSGATWTFSGFMTAFAVSAVLNTEMMATAEIKISGDITVTAG